MKTFKWLSVAAALLLGLGVAMAADADGKRHYRSHGGVKVTKVHDGHHRHFRSQVVIGFGFGSPYWWDPWYSPRYYPVPVVVPAQPTVHIEQGGSQSLEPGYWYYCGNPAGYYPAVRTCLLPWQKVLPQ